MAKRKRLTRKGIKKITVILNNKLHSSSSKVAIVTNYRVKEDGSVVAKYFPSESQKLTVGIWSTEEEFWTWVKKKAAQIRLK